MTFGGRLSKGALRRSGVCPIYPVTHLLPRVVVNPSKKPNSINLSQYQSIGPSLIRSVTIPAIIVVLFKLNTTLLHNHLPLSPPFQSLIKPTSHKAYLWRGVKNEGRQVLELQSNGILLMRNHQLINKLFPSLFLCPG